MSAAARRRWVRALGSVLVPALWSGFAVPPAQAAQAAQATQATETVDVWVDLELPALATAQPKDPARRAAQRDRVLEQQRDVMAQLAALGARELGRVQRVRNALAVRLPRDQLDAARRLHGVRSVSPVRDRERPPPQPID